MPEQPKPGFRIPCAGECVTRTVRASKISLCSPQLLTTYGWLPVACMRKLTSGLPRTPKNSAEGVY